MFFMERKSSRCLREGRSSRCSPWKGSPVNALNEKYRRTLCHPDRREGSTAPSEPRFSSRTRKASPQPGLSKQRDLQSRLFVGVPTLVASPCHSFPRGLRESVSRKGDTPAG